MVPRSSVFKTPIPRGRPRKIEKRGRKKLELVVISSGCLLYEDMTSEDIN